tara:strand:+ start:1174 stop:1596 length:423 start_codon:yes stop_codon:yes gene_type:complete
VGNKVAYNGKEMIVSMGKPVASLLMGISAIVDALKVNSSLRSLNLGFNQIGDAGSKAVAEALRVNSSLTSLNLRGCGIATEGGVAIAEALKVNGSLTSLNLPFKTLAKLMLQHMRALNCTYGWIGMVPYGFRHTHKQERD